jgi:membrane protease YdiL (CAAX protease family)
MRDIREAWAALTAGPSYPPEPADLRTIDVVGLRLPVRASIAVAVVTFALLFDYSRTFMPEAIGAADSGSDALVAFALERLVLFGLVPLAVVVLAFRDRPGRYGLTLGEWRWGAALTIIGCLVMTPVILWFATMPDVGAYYAGRNAPVGQLLAATAIDLTATEFAFRGFLMLTLVRLIGPFGVLVATMPFVFSHLGKPELELLSTLGGGLIYGWLAWRTRSIVWGSIGHTYVLVLISLAAAQPL